MGQGREKRRFRPFSVCYSPRILAWPGAPGEYPRKTIRVGWPGAWQAAGAVRGILRPPGRILWAKEGRRGDFVHFLCAIAHGFWHGLGHRANIREKPYGWVSQEPGRRRGWSVGFYGRRVGFYGPRKGEEGDFGHFLCAIAHVFWHGLGHRANILEKPYGWV